MPSATPFNTMLVDHLPRLRGYAMGLTRNRASADDLLQEAAYRALRAQSQFAVGTNFSAWMYRIVRNEFISSLRRAKRLPVPIETFPESLFAQKPEQEDFIFSRQVARAMDQLPPAQRQVLELICNTGLSYNEAAETIKCSIGTVKSRLWRARQQLALLLQGNGPTSKPRVPVPMGQMRDATEHL